MNPARRRQYVLAALLLVLLGAAAVLLREVLATTFFAVTVAYVLYPLREQFRDRGLSRRMAAAAVSAIAFGAVLVALGLVAIALYRRRESIVTLLREFPEELTLTVGEMTYTVPTAMLVEPATAAVRGLAVTAASAAPVLGLKLFLFAILLFGLLLRPSSAARVVFNVVPGQYHDVVRAFHERIKQTLFGIYILQAATAAGTFLVALLVFVALGYPAPVTLAVVAGILQFVPVVGPGVLLGVLAVVDLMQGNVTRAVSIAVVGGVLIGLLPDAVIRPRLASYAAHLPMSLYFVGFVGGVLSLGAVGFIAGPLVVALVVEAVLLLSNGRGAPT
ncbi:AI-2E family transporter [Halorarius litoreus]|uniref:AI-2E family transporter n=1 Tax=Halorarius litoreus TaxID=2962676 RepID=UPI0020CD44DB|nr:AI-2E family transporter [Halorarius litoreus]